MAQVEIVEIEGHLNTGQQFDVTATTQVERDTSLVQVLEVSASITQGVSLDTQFLLEEV